MLLFVCHVNKVILLQDKPRENVILKYNYLQPLNGMIKSMKLVT